MHYDVYIRVCDGTLSGDASSEAVAETNTIKRNTYIGQISFLENFMTSALAIAVLLTVFRIIQFLKFSKRTSSLFGQ